MRGGSAAPGEYRRVQNYVINAATGETIYTPPPTEDVPILMRELVAWLNRPSDIHPVIVSGLAQFQLVHIHPFLDGNGRTSRLLSTLCLYRAGYDFKRLFTLSEYYDRDRTAFYRALQAVRRAHMDMTGWIEYFTKGLATQLAEVKQRGERAIRAGDSCAPLWSDRSAGARAGTRAGARQAHDCRIPIALSRAIAPDAPARPQGPGGEGPAPPPGRYKPSGVRAG